VTLLVPAGAAAAPKTGQSPACKHYCMTVEPREGPEGSVFRFEGHRWRANRRVSVTFGVYCPPGSACIDIAYFARVRTDDRGRFVFRLRAGAEQRGDEERGIRAGGEPFFSQRGPTGKHITRRPLYTVIRPG
jgi:hypothetical protein